MAYGSFSELAKVTAARWQCGANQKKVNGVCTDAPCAKFLETRKIAISDTMWAKCKTSANSYNALSSSLPTCLSKPQAAQLTRAHTATGRACLESKRPPTPPACAVNERLVGNKCKPIPHMKVGPGGVPTCDIGFIVNGKGGCKKQAGGANKPIMPDLSKYTKYVIGAEAKPCVIAKQAYNRALNNTKTVATANRFLANEPGLRANVTSRCVPGPGPGPDAPIDIGYKQDLSSSDSAACRDAKNAYNSAWAVGKTSEDAAKEFVSKRDSLQAAVEAAGCGVPIDNGDDNGNGNGGGDYVPGDMEYAAETGVGEEAAAAAVVEAATATPGDYVPLSIWDILVAPFTTGALATDAQSTDQNTYALDAGDGAAMQAVAPTGTADASPYSVDDTVEGGMIYDAGEGGMPIVAIESVDLESGNALTTNDVTL